MGGWENGCGSRMGKLPLIVSAQWPVRQATSCGSDRVGGREGRKQLCSFFASHRARPPPPPPPVLPSLRSLFGGSTPVQLSSWLSDERSKENAVRSLTHSAIHPSIPACGWVVGSRYRSASHTLTKGKKRRILRPTLSYIRTCPASRYPTYILHGQLARCVGRF